MDKFLQVFPQLKADVLEWCHHHNVPQHAVDWMTRNLDHNVQGGKMNRGLAVVDSLKLICTPTPLQLQQAHILGWCVEWLQAFFLVADDIMDQSWTRRGQPCWFRLESVGHVAINDAFILESCIYMFLRKYFRQEKCYVSLLELFQETSLQTEMGQLLDLLTAPQDKVDLSKFTMDTYKWIVKHKTAYYSFYLPVALAMILAGVDSDEALDYAKEILLPLGEYFQVQDDYLDCFGDAEVMGKIGTDIQDNKCSWLIVQALTKASEEQALLLKENYGRQEEECVERVKQVYKDLHLDQVYHEYEQTIYQHLKHLMQRQQSLLNPEIFVVFLDKIYKRNK